MSEIKVERLTEKELEKIDISSWSSWECEPSVFDWQYAEQESAYVFEGYVIVKTSSGETVIKGGDFVHFPKGLKCNWTVKEKIRKVYTFNFKS